MFNYKKFLIVSTVISSCLLTLGGYKASADERYTYMGGKCYPANSHGNDDDMQQGRNPHYSNNNNQGMMPNRDNMHQGQNPYHDQGMMPNRMDNSMMQGQRKPPSPNNSKTPSSDDGFIYTNQMMPAATLRGDSVDRFKGKIKSVNKVMYPDGTRVEIVVSTDEGDKTVFLGPEMHLNKERVKLITGDTVQVHAYRVTVNGNVVYMASEVRKNGNVLRLRDQYRQPVWQKSQKRGSMW